jgi:hypothetical protein
MSKLRQTDDTSLREQATRSVKIFEYQIRFLDTQIKLRHREFDLSSIRTLWKNKRAAVKHLMTLKAFLSAN